MVFNLTHFQLILRYKENGGRIEPEVGNIIFLLISYHINIMAKKMIYYQVYIIIF
jgi:hypothetical protein